MFEIHGVLECLGVSAMVEKVARSVEAKGQGTVSAKGVPRPYPKANIEVRLVVRERVRKDPDRPVHMADVKVPGLG